MTELDKAKGERYMIKVIALTSSLIEVRKKAIDALAAYGKEAIPDIVEVVGSSITQEIKTYGLAKVEGLKKT